MQVLLLVFMMGVCVGSILTMMCLVHHGRTQPVRLAPDSGSGGDVFEEPISAKHAASGEGSALPTFGDSQCQDFPNSSTDRYEKWQESQKLSEIYIKDGRDVDGLFHLRSTCSVLKVQGFYTKSLAPCAICGGVSTL